MQWKWKSDQLFYQSAVWSRKRLQILERDHWECQDCRKRLEEAAEKGIILKGRDREIRRAEQVHHIKELATNHDLALEDDNLISLCIP